VTEGSTPVGVSTNPACLASEAGPIDGVRAARILDTAPELSPCSGPGHESGGRVCRGPAPFNTSRAGGRVTDLHERHRPPAAGSSGAVRGFRRSSPFLASYFLARRCQSASTAALARVACPVLSEGSDQATPTAVGSGGVAVRRLRRQSGFSMSTNQRAQWLDPQCSDPNAEGWLGRRAPLRSG
jgi:hypothetical protein